MSIAFSLEMVANSIRFIEKATGKHFSIKRSFDYGENYYYLEVKGDTGKMVVMMTIQEHGQVNSSVLFYPKGGGIETVYPVQKTGPDMFKTFDQVAVEAIRKLSDQK